MLVDDLVEIMNLNPEMVVEISSFADCRGTKKYNLSLSDKRSNTIINYVRERVINKSRIYSINKIPRNIINSSENIHFINSNESLSDLNAMLERYERAPPKGKSKLAVRIQDKINSYDPDVQDDLSSISSVLDKPVAGGVAFRGEYDGLKDLSVTNECFGTGGIAFKKIVLIHK